MRNQYVKPLAIGRDRGGFLKGFPRPDVLLSNNGGAPSYCVMTAATQITGWKFYLLERGRIGTGAVARLKLTSGDWSMTAQRMDGMSYQSA